MDRIMAKSTVRSAVRLVRSREMKGLNIGLRRFANAFGSLLGISAEQYHRISYKQWPNTRFCWY